MQNLKALHRFVWSVFICVQLCFVEFAWHELRPISDTPCNCAATGQGDWRPLAGWGWRGEGVKGWSLNRLSRIEFHLWREQWRADVESDFFRCQLLSISKRYEHNFPGVTGVYCILYTVCFDLEKVNLHFDSRDSCKLFWRFVSFLALYQTLYHTLSLLNLLVLRL